ncbi:DUF1629 domain-containing protein [Clostridium sp.]|uniref:imm11 family protein n=1 Tax=Clostridium sp. TaxID=1506 RepID=UPI00261DD37F|nr:DUF1629 domain-containing protein [Clostridium sp.]
MDYFLLKQDDRYTNTPRLLDINNKIDFRNIKLVNAHKIDDIIICNVKCDEETKFLDVLDSQRFLVSENMKRILEKYNEKAIFKTIPLIDSHNNRQENYYLPIFEEIEALSEKAELNLDKTVVKKIILDNKKIEGKKIFQIKESVKPLIVVRLDVAESLLRRRFKGIRLEQLEIDD